MNEPSIFFAQDRMDDTIDAIAELKGKNLDLDTFQKFTGLVDSLANNTEDFKNFITAQTWELCAMTKFITCSAII